MCSFIDVVVAYMMRAYRYAFSFALLQNCHRTPNYNRVNISALILFCILLRMFTLINSTTYINIILTAFTAVLYYNKHCTQASLVHLISTQSFWYFPLLFPEHFVKINNTFLMQKITLKTYWYYYIDDIIDTWQNTHSVALCVVVFSPWICFSNSHQF